MKINLDLTTLNDPQREAVEHIDDPTLVLAGAGSGKTRVITHKIAYLVSRGTKPWQILAVTFTNKAAREMAGRVEKLLNIPVQGLWIGTFHSMCVRILRREAERWGFSRNFTIFDRTDQLAVLKKVIHEMDIKKNRLNPAYVLHIIGRAKNDFVHRDELHHFISGRDADLLVSIYCRYEELLQVAGAFDFDDLIARPVEMFRKDQEALGRWQKRFSHILVDEYQDTNRSQYLFMKLLTGNSGNVTVVGDDDQSIYSWRGAHIENILGFEHEFQKVKIIRLEKNYRSTGIILHAANTVVANNKKRMTKRLWTDHHEGSPVKILECWNDRNEAERVISSIEREMKEYRHALKDCVILYRTNAQSRAFEEVLRRRGIRYIIVGGLRFYERKEIKDILAYLRILANPDDPISFTRAVTTPKRGIGETTIEKLEKYASEKGISLMDALGKADEILSPGAIRNKLEKFNALLQPVIEMKGKSRLNEICHALVEAIDYNEYLKTEFPDTFEERINNVNELITAMGEFENITDEDDLSTFLAEVSLMTDIDTWDDNTDAVTLMTLHSAKGLEFPSVYISGVENGLFPLPNSFDSDSELEEERRLFYVGITRAREHLHVSYAVHRPRYGSYSGGASMFVNELPEEVLEFESAERFQEVTRPIRNQRITRVMEFEDYSQEIPDSEDLGPFKIGAYVRHPTFGRGQILGFSGSGDDIILTIIFGNEVKKIMAKYTKLAPA